jgi:hypothetical protein
LGQWDVTFSLSPFVPPGDNGLPTLPEGTKVRVDLDSIKDFVVKKKEENKVGIRDSTQIQQIGSCSGYRV